ncbi:MAG: histidine phosphatase family protein [bacterium]|nr:histidine phosphatase family protein [bacterium]
MRIYLIRHGRQSSTLCNVNVPLAKEGVRQAQLAGKRLAAYDIDAVYASDLLRAKETAAIIKNEIICNANNTKLSETDPINIREELREIDFGELEGRSDEEIKVVYKEFLKQRDLLEEDLAFPGGECGRDVIKRVSLVLEELKESSYENVVIVTHGGAIRSILTSLLDMNPANKLLISLSLENTSITELFYSPDKNRFYVERLNDYAHLEGEKELLRRNWKR